MLPDHQPHLFVVKVWWESTERDTRGEWRGSVEHIPTHEKRYFRETAALSEFVSGRVGWRPLAQNKEYQPSETLFNQLTQEVNMTKNGYAHPEVLVDTQWVADHLNDPNLRLVEVDVDTAAYDSGHVTGAIGWNWKRDTQDTLRRDMPDQPAFEELMVRSGIGNTT